MIKKLLVTSFLLLFWTFSSFSQEKKVLISGKITDSLGVVKNANIINLKTNQGTFSSDNGVFRIFVSIGDSLSISSIQHITKVISINKNIIYHKNLAVNLNFNVYVLDEFDLKRHNLSGSLSIDIKDVPSDRRDSLLRKSLDFSNIDWNATVKDDYIDKRVRPQMVKTSPIVDAGFGLGVGANMPFKYSERLWALRKNLARKKAFPYKILSELGEKFFFKELKIPVENYFHFLEYCNPLGIENLYKEAKLLELIQILRQESIKYLKIIKKE